MITTRQKHHQPIHSNYRLMWICLVLSLSILAIYWQVSQHEFVNFDDGRYIGDLKKYQGRPLIESVYRSFAITGLSHWHPLTSLSHRLDVHLFGMKPRYHLLTSVLLHILNCLLLFGVLYKMTGVVWQSACVAALFAVHPLNVESVAWVSERKNVLSTCFWMLTLLAYYQYTRKPLLSNYLLTLMVYLLGLLAKPMLVTLPFVFLLLDFWPLKRLRLDRARPTPDQTGHALPSMGAGHPYLYLVLEKIPFFILSAISIKISALSFKNPLISLEAVPLSLRLANGVVSYISYLGKLMLPYDLAAYYPYPDRIDSWQTTVAVIILGTVSGLVLWKARKLPYLAVGWLWFVGTLVPVLGLIQAGLWPALADRYAYVPQIGIFIMCGWGVGEVMDRWRISDALVRMTAVIAVIVLAVVAWHQVGYWKNSLTFFEHMLAVTGRNPVAHLGLGVSLAKEKRPVEAVDHFNKALALNPNYAEAHNSLGAVLISQGKVQAAIGHFRRAGQIKPTYAVAYNNLGLALVRQGRLTEAISYFKRAAGLRKDFSGARRNLVLTQTVYREITQAIEGLREALAARFEQPQLDAKLKRLSAAKKGLIHSVRRFERSLARHPGPQPNVVIQIPTLDEAAAEYDALLPVFKRLVASAPVNAGAYYHMACLSARNGAPNEAIDWLHKALQNGFDDWDIIGTDPDLDAVRSCSKYEGLGHKFKHQPGKSG